MRAHVLIVDDDPQLRRSLADRLVFWGHSVEEAPDGEAALAATSRRQFDLIVLDLAMPGRPGLEVLKSWRDSGEEADIVVLTAHGSVESAVEAMRRGATDFLLKPADFEILKAAVERSLKRRRLERENRALREQATPAANRLLGESAPMKSLLETATRAAASNATVLLTGESGTGKQRLAEFLHEHSPVKDGPFVYVNCMALSDDLIESTLFGHEKGAFTGATSKKEGRLEAAADGTAFLDEIGDITPRLQAKLLHFLETGEFERLGGTRTLSIQCRVIAATNRDLPKAVKDGRFREDLFYRLNVIHLQLPPLRERREDIPLLAQSFIDRYAGELGKGRLTLPAATQQILSVYSWPGNVRQLRNAVERMVVLAPGVELGADLLPPEVASAIAADRTGVTTADTADTSNATSLAGTRLPLRDAMRAFERDYLSRVLARTGGNQTKAAELLGLQRTYLNRRLHELELVGKTPGESASSAREAE